MRDPNITSRILAAIDRSDDPHLHIDILREADLEQSEAISKLQRDMKLLQDSERDRLTETGVIRTVAAEFSKREINWMKWAVRAALGSLGAASLALASWIFKLALRGLTA